MIILLISALVVFS